MSKKKQKYNFNIFKKNVISPFNACLNGNGNTIAKENNKLNNITKSKSKIISDKTNKSSLQFQKNNNNYMSLITQKNTSSLFLDHTFATSKNIVLSQLQNKNLFLNKNYKEKKESVKQNEQRQEINIKTYLNDLKKTFYLNMEIIAKICNKDKKIIEIIDQINKKIKYKENIQTKIEKIKGVMIIEKQIQSEHIRKIGENEVCFKEQINLSLDKITMKDEYIIILMKKLKELEIYSKRKSSAVGSGFEKYKNFRVSEFIDTNTKYLQQKHLYLTEIESTENNIKKIKKENYDIKESYEAIKKKNKKNKIKEANIQKYIKFYNYNCDIISSKIMLIKNTLQQISKKYFFIKVSPKLQELINNDEDNKNNNKNKISNKNKNYLKKSLISNISASIDLTNMNNDMTKRLESFIDLSVILNDNKNNDITNIFDTISHGNVVLKKADFGKVSKIK